MKYDETKDFKPPKDLFEPVSTPPAEHLRLPKDLEVEFVGDEATVKKMEVLVGQKMIGVDSEWRPQMSKQHKTKGIALLQIAGFNEVFLVDLIALRNSKKLDEMLTRIFTHKTSLILGFSFHADMSMFRRDCPNLNFYNHIPNLVDV